MSKVFSHLEEKKTKKNIHYKFLRHNKICLSAFSLTYFCDLGTANWYLIPTQRKRFLNVENGQCWKKLNLIIYRLLNKLDLVFCNIVPSMFSSELAEFCLNKYIKYCCHCPRCQKFLFNWTFHSLDSHLCLTTTPTITTCTRWLFRLEW